MDNVVILDSYEVVTGYSFNWNAVWVTAIATFIIALVAYLATVWECEVLPWTLALISLWIFCTAVIGGLFGATIAAKPSEYTTEYKVYLEGNVDMTEFTDTYEIISQEGLIFIVREK